MGGAGVEGAGGARVEGERDDAIQFGISVGRDETPALAAIFAEVNAAVGAGGEQTRFGVADSEGKNFAAGEVFGTLPVLAGIFADPEGAVLAGGVVEAGEEAFGLVRVNGEGVEGGVGEAGKGELLPGSGGGGGAEEEAGAGAGEERGGVGAIDGEQVNAAAVGPKRLPIGGLQGGGKQ